MVPKNLKVPEIPLPSICQEIVQKRACRNKSTFNENAERPELLNYIVLPGGYDLHDGGEGGGDASDEDLDEKPSGPAGPTRPVRSLASLPAGSCYSSPRSRRWAWRRARTRCPCPRCCSSPHHHARCFHYYYPLLLHLSGSYCGFLTMPDAPGYCCSRSCHFSHGRCFN